MLTTKNVCTLILTILFLLFIRSDTDGSWRCLWRRWWFQTAGKEMQKLVGWTFYYIRMSKCWIRIRIKSMRIHNPAFNKYDKKERFIILFFHSDKLKRKAERVEAKQKTSEEKNDRSCCCTICPQIISKPIRLLNKKDVYQHRIPKNLLLTHLFLLETRSRTRTRFVASNSWLKDWPRKRWIFYAVTNSVRNLDPADQQKPNVL
jgi:hypothetical protein